MKKMYLFLVLMFISFVGLMISPLFNEMTFFADGSGYYSYLPSIFLNTEFSQLTGTSFIKISNLNLEFIKYPPGVAILQLPFFGFAHIITVLSKTYLADGTTLYYKIFGYLGSFFYFSIGTVLIFKFLNKKFNENIVFLTIFMISFGVGILYYITYFALYSHIYSYFLYSLLIYLLSKEKDFITSNKEKSYLFLIGSLIGFMCIVRNTNVLALIIFFFYDIKNKYDLISRVKFLLRNISFFIFGFILFLSPMLIYWKIKTGHFIINTYSYPSLSDKLGKTQDHLPDKFDFFKPHIFSVLFSVKKGLFTYFPILIMPFCALFFLKERLKEFYLSFILFLICFIYLTSSWHDWWYATSFGQRPFIDIMPIFMILFSILLDKFQNSNTVKNLILFLATCFILINTSFLYMSHNGIFFDENGSLEINKVIKILHVD